MTLWHYAVFKGIGYYEPACMRRRDIHLLQAHEQHGITINRGQVNCIDCRRMMGIIV